MASLKEIRGRIASVRGTLKITSAMRLIASAKLHSSQNAMGGMVPYEQNLNRIFNNLLSGCPSAAKELNPYFEPGSALEAEDREQALSVAKTAVVLVTSNQTLCGSFNASIVKEFDSLGLSTDKCKVYAVGKYGMKYLRKQGYEVVDCCSLAGHPSYGESSALAQSLIEDFTAGKVARVLIVYAHFVSSSSNSVSTKEYLPFKTCGIPADRSVEETDYIVEPSPREVVRLMLPNVLLMGFHTALLDSATAEHAARTLAMQIASENAENLLGELSLTYNKLRQQAITNEILDLIGGQNA